MSQMQRRIASLKISFELAIAAARADAHAQRRLASTIEDRNASATPRAGASVGSQAISTWISWRWPGCSVRAKRALPAVEPLGLRREAQPRGAQPVVEPVIGEQHGVGADIGRPQRAMARRLRAARLEQVGEVAAGTPPRSTTLCATTS